jgi:glycosyltransferase involved in cell wall biosynthesis
MVDKLKVVQIISGFGIESPLGGIERFVVEMTSHLDQAKIIPGIYGLWSFQTPFEDKWIDILNRGGIKTYLGPVWDPLHPYQSFWKAYQKMRQALRGVEIDILHSHGQFCDVAALLKNGAGRKSKILRTVHQVSEWRKSPLRRAVLTNWLYPFLFDWEIGINPEIERSLSQRHWGRISRQKVAYIPNAINLERFKLIKINRDQKRHSLGIPSDSFVIGAIGRLSIEKGFANLLEAAKIVLDSNPRIHFVVIGEGDQRQGLEAMKYRLSIQDHVTFTGPRSDIEELFVAMDLFVSSSYWEAFPTVILESMAAGVPVIATQTTGAKILLRNNENGWLVPSQDSIKLANAIMSAINQPDLCLSYAQQASQDVLNYSIRAVAERYTDLYQRMAHSK